MAPGKVAKFSKIAIEEDEKRDTFQPEGKLSLNKSKKVTMDKPNKMSGTQSIIHLSLYERMMIETQKILHNRSQMEIYEKIDNKVVNVTPKLMEISHESESYAKLKRKYSTMQIMSEISDTVSFKSAPSSLMRSRSSRAVGLRLSLEDIINIGSERMILDLQPSARHSWHKGNFDSSSSSLSEIGAAIVSNYKLPFIRIVLRKTELQLLYEQHSMTAIKCTEDGNLAEADNKEYEYLTIGGGKVRRRSEAEAQTYTILFKSRGVSTIRKQTCDVESYVSHFEAFDTYKLIDNRKHGFQLEEPKKLPMPQSKTVEEQFEIINQLPSFNSACIIIKRLLASNIFERGQKRFRNMVKFTRLADKIKYKYSLRSLFTIYLAFKDNERKSVCDMSFCYTNSDILAVGYGIYSYQAAKQPKKGEVCIWSIKNPCNPERFYYYDVPVVSLEFSPYTPNLLAIGLYDGSVEVRDIALYNQPPIAVSQRSSSHGIEPILAIKWIKQTNSGSHQDIDPFLALSQDGSTIQFHIINSPYFSSFKQMALERIEGAPEGLQGINYSNNLNQNTNRLVQGLNLIVHPVHLDIYYVLTDEGCVYKCSTNYQQQYLQVLKTHEASVNVMEFSPWSPKLFLTCGNDWCIRIWMEGIFQPLITLKNLCAPYQWAAWSRTHSTILIGINRKQCEIWDLKRSILKPMSCTSLNPSYNTMGIFSLDGHSIVIGNEQGRVFVNALDDMPFPPYYQYDTLEKAIYKAVSNYSDLLIELKSMGYFGYPNKGYVKPR